MPNFFSIMLIILSILTSIYCEQVSYKNYKVFRIVPMTTEQIEALYNLQTKKGYSFWMEPSGLSKPVDLQVAPTQLNEFYSLMEKENMNYQLSIANLQAIIDQQKASSSSRANGYSFDSTRYQTLEEIYSWMDQLAENHEDIVQKIIGGHTYQGRQIEGVKLSFFEQRPGIFIEGGIHPREWISPATVTFLIDQLLNNRSPRIRELADSYDWYIFPICNPDGYVYTHDSDRMWRKSLSDTGAGPDPDDSDCRGVDLNRNFGYKWQEYLVPTTDPCSEIYPGSGPFSEIETRTLAEFVKSLKGKIFAYISFHSYSQLLLFPFGYTSAHIGNYDKCLTIADHAVLALGRKYGTEYTTGNIGESVYRATGGSTDWVKGVMKLPLVYVYEMRDTGQYGFLLPPEQIIPNGEEILDSLISMFRQAKAFGYPKPKRSFFGKLILCVG